MKNKLVNFDLDNWVLDCHSESINAFIEFLIEDAEKQIKNFWENYKYKDKLDKILEKIKNPQNNFKNLKDYFNKHKKNNFLAFDKDNINLGFFSEKINKLYFNWIYFNENIFNEIIINKWKTDLKQALIDYEISIWDNNKLLLWNEWGYYSIWDRKKYFIVFLYNNGDTKEFLTEVVEENFDYKKDWLQILNKKIQKQIIESEEYWEYLETFIKPCKTPKKSPKN
jgi:hypothetical protein